MNYTPNYKAEPGKRFGNEHFTSRHLALNQECLYEYQVHIRHGSYTDCKEWIDRNIQSDWCWYGSLGDRIYSFKEEIDAVAFKLVWKRK